MSAQKKLWTVTSSPTEEIQEGDTIGITLEKSGVAIVLDDLFVAHVTPPSPDNPGWSQVTLEAKGAEPTYGNRTLRLASQVITWWQPVERWRESAAHVWTA
jgi:hypothetical protein